MWVRVFIALLAALFVAPFVVLAIARAGSSLALFGLGTGGALIFLGPLILLIALVALFLKQTA